TARPCLGAGPEPLPATGRWRRRRSFREARAGHPPSPSIGSRQWRREPERGGGSLGCALTETLCAVDRLSADAAALDGEIGCRDGSRRLFGAGEGHVGDALATAEIEQQLTRRSRQLGARLGPVAIQDSAIPGD